MREQQQRRQQRQQGQRQQQRPACISFFLVLISQQQWQELGGTLFCRNLLIKVATKMAKLGKYDKYGPVIFLV